MNKTLYAYEWNDGDIRFFSKEQIHVGGRTFIGTTTLEIEPVMKEVVKEVPVEQFSSENAYWNVALPKGVCIPLNAYDAKITYRIKEPVK